MAWCLIKKHSDNFTLTTLYSYLVTYFSVRDINADLDYKLQNFMTHIASHYSLHQNVSYRDQNYSFTMSVWLQYSWNKIHFTSNLHASCHVLTTECHTNGKGKGGERGLMYQSWLQELSRSENFKLHLLNGRDKWIYKNIKVMRNLVKGKTASNFLTSRASS
jgi:hypothetical protein